MERSLQDDNVYTLDRIKPKNLYKMAYGDIKYLNRQRQQLYQNTWLRVIGLLVFAGLLFLAGIGGENPLPFFAMMFVIFGIILVGVNYSSKKQKLVSDFKRISIMGMVSRALKNSSYNINLMFDTRSKTSKEFIYSEARSPYSHAQKYYHYMVWLVYDTNLKNNNPIIDGVKFKIDSFLKTKTKSGSVVREILTIKIKFFFKIDFIMTQVQYDKLLHKLKYEVLIPDYESLVFIEFPNDSTIRFKLKIITPIEHFFPYYLPAIIQDFWNDVILTWNDQFSTSLLPLKAKTENTKKILEKTTKVTDFPKAKLVSDPYERVNSSDKETLEDALDNISITMGSYEKDVEGSVTRISYTPSLNYFKSINFTISDYFEMEFVSVDRVRLKQSFSINVREGTINHVPGSDPPSKPIEDQYRVKRHLTDAKATGSMDYIHVRTSDDYQLTITITTKKTTPQFLEQGVSFAKSLLQELKYL